MIRYFSFVILIILGIRVNGKAQDIKMEKEINKIWSNVEGDFSLVFYDLKEKKGFSIRPNEVYHAASTMKTAVMLEVFKQARAKKIKLNEMVTIKNEFTSIKDGSKFSLSIGDDSDEVVYKNIGKKMTIKDLVFYMMTVSSNLATNILIEKVGAEAIRKTLKENNIKGLNVMRGVEDIPAFRAGLNNTTTAEGLKELFIYVDKYPYKEDRKEMLDILKAQKFNEMIPALLPKNVQVAHKTGNVTGVEHDSGIVYLPNGQKYVLILLSKNLKDSKKGTQAFAEISKLIYDNFSAK